MCYDVAAICADELRMQRRRVDVLEARLEAQRRICPERLRCIAERPHQITEHSTAVRSASANEMWENIEALRFQDSVGEGLEVLVVDGVSNWRRQQQTHASIGGTGVATRWLWSSTVRASRWTRIPP